ncbi:MAG: hypothetical protein PHU88_06650 [candidate division Zixibacteria bacterium]|nr:hypothetical protein [candidate division Zixibacteria bacterium]MDD5426923.1 hypothetical protein [candidate division Zixibacteria bacterium]
MIKSLLSQIRILPAERIYPFEWYEPKLNPDDLNVNELNLIRHPFMVSCLPDNNYLLLGQTTLFRALQDAGLKHFPIQICRNEHLRFLPQKISLVDFTVEDMSRFALKFPKQVIFSPQEQPCLSNYISFQFTFNDEPPLWIYLRDSTRNGCPLPLEIIFKAILARGSYVPVYECREFHDTIFKARRLNNIISLPTFELVDLKAAAMSERLFPPDIIKVFSSTRIVNIDFPLTVLDSDLPLDEKESFLRELIAYREQANRTIFLEGTVYILNI